MSKRLTRLFSDSNTSQHKIISIDSNDWNTHDVSFHLQKEQPHHKNQHQNNNNKHKHYLKQEVWQLWWMMYRARGVRQNHSPPSTYFTYSIQFLNESHFRVRANQHKLPSMVNFIVIGFGANLTFHWIVPTIQVHLFEELSMFYWITNFVTIAKAMRAQCKACVTGMNPLKQNRCIQMESKGDHITTTFCTFLPVVCRYIQTYSK